MATAACFMRQAAPGCSATSSETEAIKPARLRIGGDGSAFLPQAEGRDFSFLRLHMQLGDGASSRSVCGQRSLQAKQRVFIVPYSKMGLIATHCFFLRSFRFGLFSPPAFAFPYYFSKIENVWAA